MEITKQDFSSNIDILAKDTKAIETQSPIDENRLNGVVYTPHKVAEALTKKALSFLKIKQPTVLDPSVGDGAFLSALKSQSKKNIIATV